MTRDPITGFGFAVLALARGLMRTPRAPRNAIGPAARLADRAEPTDPAMLALRRQLLAEIDRQERRHG